MLTIPEILLIVSGSILVSGVVIASNKSTQPIQDLNTPTQDINAPIQDFKTPPNKPKMATLTPLPTNKPSIIFIGNQSIEVMNLYLHEITKPLSYPFKYELEEKTLWCIDPQISNASQLYTVIGLCHEGLYLIVLTSNGTRILSTVDDMYSLSNDNLFINIPTIYVKTGCSRKGPKETLDSYLKYEFEVDGFLAKQMANFEERNEGQNQFDKGKRKITNLDFINLRLPSIKDVICVEACVIEDKDKYNKFYVEDCEESYQLIQQTIDKYDQIIPVSSYELFAQSMANRFKSLI